MFRCNASHYTALSENNNLSLISDSFCSKPEIAEKIPILRLYRINDKRYTERVVYESFKPNNLKQMQHYMNFVFSLRTILPNQVNLLKDNNLIQQQERIYADSSIDKILTNPKLSKEIKDYYNIESKLNIPIQIGNLLF